VFTACFFALFLFSTFFIICMEVIVRANIGRFTTDRYVPGGPR
jgi:hypothetical protein